MTMTLILISQQVVQLVILHKWCGRTVWNLAWGKQLKETVLILSDDISLQETILGRNRKMF